MRVLLIAPAFTPARGGGEQLLRDLADSLHRAGEEVTVLTPELGAERNAYNVLRRTAAFRVGGQRAFGPVTAWAAMEQARPDVILTSGPDLNEWTARFLAALRGLPVVSCYVADLDLSRWQSRLFTRWHMLVLRTCTRVVVLSERYRAVLLERGLSEDKVECIPPGVPLKATHLRNESHQREGLLFVGVLDRAHSYKRLDLLLEALHAVPERERPRLTVVGEGELRRAHEELAARLGLTERVHFAGAVDDAVLLELYAASLALVLPSPDGREGFGLVLLEAAAAGCPVIATSAIGSANLLADAGIRLSAPNDAGALAASILALCRDRSHRERQTEAVERLARAHSWEAAARKWRDCLLACVAKRSGCVPQAPPLARRHWLTLVALAFGIACFWRTLATPGSILYSFEWYTPPYPYEIRHALAEDLSPWTQQNFGLANVFPSMAYILALEALFSFLGGGDIDKVVLVATVVSAFCGYFRLLTTLDYNRVLSLGGAAVYAGSPFLFNHAAAGHIPYLGAIAVAPYVYNGLVSEHERPRAANWLVILLMPLVAQLQAFASLATLLFASCIVFRTARVVAYAVGAVAVWLVANAFWLLPLALSLQHRLQTLASYFPTNLQANIVAGSRPLLLALRLEPYSNPMSLAVEQHAGMLGLTAAAASYLVPAFAAVGLIFALSRSPGPHRGITLLFGAGWIASLILFVGVDAVWAPAVVWAFSRFSALSAFKELYHFGFAISLVLPLLFVAGVRRVRWWRPVMLGGALAWTFPLWFTGNVGGWAQPVAPSAYDKRAASIASDGLHRLLVLPNAGNMRVAGRLSARGPIDGVDHLLVYGTEPSFGSWLPVYPVAVALDRALDDGDSSLAWALLPYTNVDAVYLRSSPVSMFARDDVVTEAATLAPLIQDGLLRPDTPADRGLLPYSFWHVRQSLPVIYGTTARYRSVDAVAALAALAFAGVAPAAVTDEPGWRPLPVVATSSVDAEYLACGSCLTLELGDMVNDSYDPSSGWVSGNVSSNWIAYYDSYPGPLSSHFLYTTSNAPLAIKLPEPFPRFPLLAVRAILAHGSVLRVRYGDGPWRIVRGEGVHWIPVHSDVRGSGGVLDLSGAGARVIDRVIAGLHAAPLAARGAALLDEPKTRVLVRANKGLDVFHASPGWSGSGYRIQGTELDLAGRGEVYKTLRGVAPGRTYVLRYALASRRSHRLLLAALDAGTQVHVSSKVLAQRFDSGKLLLDAYPSGTIVLLRNEGSNALIDVRLLGLYAAPAAGLCPACRPLPVAHWEIPLGVARESETDYDVTLPRGAGAFTLVLSQNFDTAWHLEHGGVPVVAPHFAVNGGLNGWALPANAPREFHVVYGSASNRRAGAIVTVVGLLATLTAVLGAVHREKGGRPSRWGKAQRGFTELAGGSSSRRASPRSSPLLARIGAGCKFLRATIHWMLAATADNLRIAPSGMWIRDLSPLSICRLQPSPRRGRRRGEPTFRSALGPRSR